jgi:hypothetical protein
MKLSPAAAITAVLLLSACTDADWSRTMSFIDIPDTTQRPQPKLKPKPVAARTMPALAAPMPAARPAGLNPFCASVAKQDSESSAFDAATQQSVFVRSYQQCVTIFGNTAPQ